MPRLLPLLGALGGSCCRDQRARRPRGCHGAGVGPVGGRVTVAYGLGHHHPPPTHMPRRGGTASLSRVGKAVPFLPRSRSCPPAGHGLPLVTRVPRGEAWAAGLGALWHGGAGSCPRPYVPHLYARLRRAAAAGRERGTGGGAGPRPPFPFPCVPSLPPTLHPSPRPPDADGRCRARSRGPAPAWCVSAGKKKFPPPPAVLVEAGEGPQRVPLAKVARQRSGVGKAGRDAFGTRGLQSREFLPLCLPRPREGTWQGPRQGRPRNSRLYFP